MNANGSSAERTGEVDSGRVRKDRDATEGVKARRDERNSAMAAALLTRKLGMFGVETEWWWKWREMGRER